MQQLKKSLKIKSNEIDKEKIKILVTQFNEEQNLNKNNVNYNNFSN